MKTTLQILAMALLISFSVTDTKAQGVCFLTQTVYPTGLAPVGSTTGDFNGDGKQDIAIANQAGAAGISVFLGNGNGTFPAAAPFTASTQPYGITTSDFNNDGKLDIAVANIGTPNVSILLGNGAGSFGAATQFTVGANSREVVAADFNGDMNMDLAVSAPATNSLVILMGTGGGNFGPAVKYAIGGGVSPEDIAVGEFNGDGKLDVAVMNQSSSNVSILTGNGLGVFTFSTITSTGAGNGPKGMAIADFNGDGKMDVATANNTSTGISILLGNGLGGLVLQPIVTNTIGPRDISVADFNSDGKKDIAVAGGTVVCVHLGNGVGGFGAANTFSVGNSPNSISVADFNNDGKPDVVSPGQASFDMSVLINNAPTVMAVTSNTLICGPPNQGTVTITANGATTYTWNTGAMTTNIVVSPSVTTNYTVVGSSATGCQGGAMFTQSVSACLGVAQVSSKNAELSVYPNPFSGQATLKVSLNVNSNVQISLYNSLGELINQTENKNLESGIYKYDIKANGNGLYFVTAIINGVTTTHKIIAVE